MNAKDYDRASRLRTKLQPKRGLKQKVMACYDERRSKQIVRLLRDEQPELLEALYAAFPEHSKSILNPSVVWGYFGITSKCPGCEKDTTMLLTKYCDKKCSYVSRGQLISRKRQAETQEQIDARSKKIQAAIDKDRDSWRESISKTHQAKSREEVKAAKQKGLATLRRKHGNHVTSVYDIPGLRKQMTRAHLAAIPQMLRAKEQTMLARYGVRHQAHRKDTQDKIQKFRRKQVVIGAVTHKVQGYEDHVLRHLHAQGYRIKTGLSGIPYQDAVGTDRVYFPDIIARKGKRRLLIEVKSTYTFQWTRSNCPEKFFVGTTWAQARHADYLVVVVHPGKKRMAILRNPKTKRDLRTKHAIYQELTLPAEGASPKRGAA